jgi:hypothetical protein
LTTDHETLPVIETTLDPSGVVDALKVMSKRGKLAGFRAGQESGSAVVDAHGTPFDSDLIVRSESEGGHTRVAFQVMMRRKMPIVFALILVVTIWPGLPLTESFMLGFGWYERLMGDSIQTWMWYLPLTVLPAPFAWRSAIQKSKKSAHQHALETIERIRATISS